jgi:hypothetical protein
MIPKSPPSFKSTSDLEYSLVLARLYAIPVNPGFKSRKELTVNQQNKRLYEDLLEVSGEATW